MLPVQAIAGYDLCVSVTRQAGNRHSESFWKMWNFRIIKVPKELQPKCQPTTPMPVKCVPKCHVYVMCRFFLQKKEPAKLREHLHQLGQELNYSLGADLCSGWF